MNTCPICDPKLNINDKLDWVRQSCPKCGSFNLSIKARYNLKSILTEDPKKAPVLSYAIRKMSKHNNEPKITSDIMDNIFDNTKLPNNILFFTSLPKPTDLVEKSIVS